MDREALEAFWDADLYDAEYRSWRSDAQFYRQNARQFLGAPAEILELACGSGRVTAELARDGHRIYGFDYLAPMLRRARTRIDAIRNRAAGRVSLFRADMRHFTLRRRFALIICAFNAFEHLYSHQDIAACLESVRSHLARDGVFLFDVHNPDLRTLAFPRTKAWGKKRFRLVDGSWVKRSIHSRFDRIRQIHHMKLSYQPLGDDKKTPEGAPFTRVLRQRQFFPEELKQLVENAGFEIALRLGEFDNSELDSDSPSQILFCRPK